MLVQTLFLFACVSLLAALGFWGITVRRLTGRIETAHPQAFAALRGRSRKTGARLAVSSEVQAALGGGLPLPDAVLADPACARMIRLEGRARIAMLVCGLAATGAFLAL